MKSIMRRSRRGFLDEPSNLRGSFKARRAAEFEGRFTHYGATRGHCYNTLELGPVYHRGYKPGYYGGESVTPAFYDKSRRRRSDSLLFYVVQTLFKNIFYLHKRRPFVSYFAAALGGWEAHGAHCGGLIRKTLSARTNFSCYHFFSFTPTLHEEAKVC